MTLQPAEKRRLRQRADARRAILDATEALLVTDGFERFSMRRLAQRCGYTAPTIYHHFGDKQGLIQELLEARLQTLLRALRAVPRAGDPIGTIGGLVRAFVRFGLRHPIHYRLLAERPPETEPPSLGAARDLLEAPLRELAACGRLSTDDVEAAIQTCWCTLHGAISLRIQRPEITWSPRGIDVMIETLTRGLQLETESPR